jgi:hypothetical protein
MITMSGRFEAENDDRIAPFLAERLSALHDSVDVWRGKLSRVCLHGGGSEQLQQVGCVGGA